MEAENQIDPITLAARMSLAAAQSTDTDKLTSNLDISALNNSVVIDEDGNIPVMDDYVVKPEMSPA